MASSVPDDALSLSEIARRLRVDPSTVRVWVHTGRLRAHKAGPSSHSHWWVRPEDLEQMLADRERRSPPGVPELESDYQPGPNEPGLGMLNSFDMGLDEETAR